MSKILSAKWRESATLMILAKDHLVPPEERFDYSALLFKRTEKSTFMPNSYVFPGGVNELSDESPLWLKYLQEFGVRDEQLKHLCFVPGSRPSIFSKASTDSLEREISLRITAIRETFEEVGVLCCRDRNSIDEPGGYGHIFDKLDKDYWQHLIHNDSAQFLNLCKEHDIIPDLWGLHEWAVWLTPSNSKKRFQTAFFAVALMKKPEVVLEEHEVTDFKWRSPYGFLSAHLRQELWLPPPQFYELSRLLNITGLDALKCFAEERARKGTTLMLPVQYRCKDGRVSLLPGDDKYPEDPNAPLEVIPLELSLEEFRNGAKKLHRAEFRDRNSNKLLLNFELPDGHLSPVMLRTST